MESMKSVSMELSKGPEMIWLYFSLEEEERRNDEQIGCRSLESA